MQEKGWTQFFEDWSWVRGEGKFPIPAYSEFMPPPRIGQKPYGSMDIDSPFSGDDPFGWHVRPEKRRLELSPGLARIGKQVVDSVIAMATGRGFPTIGSHHLAGNPFWPAALADIARTRAKEPFLFLSPLALSKTQDDKGRIRWTLFGASDTGPAAAFWKSFFTAPGVELPADDARDSVRQILQQAWHLPPETLEDLRAAGFRILPMGDAEARTGWREGPLPSWTRPLLFDAQDRSESVKYLLTFRPFDMLAGPLQQAYAEGRLQLLPYPGSLVFWGSPLYRQLDADLPFASQILLLQSVARHESATGIRVPQSGWLHPVHAGGTPHAEGLGRLQSGFRRSHRWQRILRGDDATTLSREDHIHQVLFSNHPDDVGLYGKPMARNVQVWSQDFRGVLHGPDADSDTIRHAIAQMAKGGSFGYRFFYPPMQAGRHAQFWHRPLIAFRDDATGETRCIDNALTGYFTAFDTVTRTYSDVAMWPRMRALSDIPHPPELANNRAPACSAPLTFHRTATRDFEVAYWKTIAHLAEGEYLNKNSGDCVRDSVTEKRLAYPERDLDALAEYLLGYYRALAREAGNGAALLVGDTPFRWQTDFDYPWMGGWQDNQSGKTCERNLVTIIPGASRREAVIMADHYDTAYMEDVYGYRADPKSDGSRIAASGADDNHSATAALQLAAPILLELSRAGRLACDVWLVHLTGEEFPSDCLGARHLAQQLVQGTLQIRLQDGTFYDVSATRVRGIYVLDMIAHNNERHRDLFKIAPGASPQSLALAQHAGDAARLWQQCCTRWNETDERRALGRGRRSPHGGAVPRMARHLAPRGEIRLHEDPHSTLFNTDGQIFSDAGIPTVLFMEKYDINRHGYHDSEDTMANIDLDYGAAVAAIAIETVAQTASVP
jgi:hypothetical protein